MITCTSTAQGTRIQDLKRRTSEYLAWSGSCIVTVQRPRQKIIVLDGRTQTQRQKPPSFEHQIAP